MKKSIFVIKSEFYCTQLLAWYIEREGNLRVFEFFNAEETLFYMGLEPAIIVYGTSDPAFTSRQLKLISASLPIQPLFLALNEEKILEFDIVDTHRLGFVQSSEYYDVYSSVRNLCGEKSAPLLVQPAK